MSGVDYSSDRTILRYAPDGLETLEIPSTVKVIYGSSSTDYAFQKCVSSFKSFSFQSGSQLQTILPYSFYSCKKITSVDFSSCSNLQTIGDYAFYGCNSISSLILPSNLNEIGIYAFYGIKISSLSLPSSIEKKQ